MVVEDAMDKNPPYLSSLQFELTKSSVTDADKPSLPGSPMRDSDQRTGSKSKFEGTEAETLAYIAAIDENEIMAASLAEKRKLKTEVLSFAKMLHTEHGKNLGDTLKLGASIGITPVETMNVDRMRVKGAEGLAKLIQLDDQQFTQDYLKAMVDGHVEVLSLIDDQLMKSAKNDQVKQHLKMTRDHIAMHLESAKKLMEDHRE